jgi:hypothetical protein
MPNAHGPCTPFWHVYDYDDGAYDDHGCHDVCGPNEQPSLRLQLQPVDMLSHIVPMRAMFAASEVQNQFQFPPHRFLDPPIAIVQQYCILLNMEDKKI